MKPLTYFVGCRLHITNFPFFGLLTFKGNEAAGNICNDEPRQRERSVLLE